MSGIFRVPGTEEYRYYSYNDYEERRLRDMYHRDRGYDEWRRRQAHALHTPPQPFTFSPLPLPAPPLPAPDVVEAPPAPPPAAEPEFSIAELAAAWQAMDPVTAIAAAPELTPAELLEAARVDWSAVDAAEHVIPPVAAWPGAPTPETATAVSFADLNPFVEQLPGPPARVGDYPDFDAAFDGLVAEGRSITYQRVNDSLVSPEALEIFRMATERP